MKLLFATHNQGKVRELNALLVENPLPLTLLSLKDLDETSITPVEETGSSFAENAILKARAMANAYNLPTMADDSGLEVDALDGRPGIFSARYGGDHLTDEERNTKLLHELMQVPDKQRTARFHAALALVFPDRLDAPIVCEGVCEGRILRRFHGTSGFGYDPIFFSTALGKSFGEATSVEKNAVSHRAQAMRKLVAYLKDTVRA